MNKIKIGGVEITLNQRQAKSLQMQLSKIIKDKPKPEPKKEPEPVVLYVPDGIKIGQGNMYNTAGIFNSNDQELYYDLNSNAWAIMKGTKTAIVKHILHPIGRHLLKPGDLFFSTDATNPDFSDLYGYRILLEPGIHIMWNKSGTVTIEKSPYKYYYKIVPDAKPL